MVAERASRGKSHRETGSVGLLRRSDRVGLVCAVSGSPSTVSATRPRIRKAFSGDLEPRLEPRSYVNLNQSHVLSHRSISASCCSMLSGQLRNASLALILLPAGTLRNLRGYCREYCHAFRSLAPFVSVIRGWNVLLVMSHYQ